MVNSFEWVMPISSGCATTERFGIERVASREPLLFRRNPLKCFLGSLQHAPNFPTPQTQLPAEVESLIVLGMIDMNPISSYDGVFSINRVGTLNSTTCQVPFMRS
jgi:hypothetical protein